MQVWDLEKQKIVTQFDDEEDVRSFTASQPWLTSFPRQCFVRSICALSNGRIATATSVKTLKFWDIEGKKPEPIVSVNKLDEEVRAF